MGLIRGKAMASPDGAVRLPLNISESRETTTGRFLTTFSGAGVQHMAMATSDILHAMATMSARGAHFLQIPSNYYDDVAAKWGLDDDRIAELRQHNVLYDRDGSGEFLHAYTEPFDDRILLRDRAAGGRL